MEWLTLGLIPRFGSMVEEGVSGSLQKKNSGWRNPRFVCYFTDYRQSVLFFCATCQLLVLRDPTSLSQYTWCKGLDRWQYYYDMLTCWMWKKLRLFNIPKVLEVAVRKNTSSISDFSRLWKPRRPCSDLQQGLPVASKSCTPCAGSKLCSPKVWFSASCL